MWNRIMRRQQPRTNPVNPEALKAGDFGSQGSMVTFDMILSLWKEIGELKAGYRVLLVLVTGVVIPVLFIILNKLF